MAYGNDPKARIFDYQYSTHDSIKKIIKEGCDDRMFWCPSITSGATIQLRFEVGPTCDKSAKAKDTRQGSIAVLYDPQDTPDDLNAQAGQLKIADGFLSDFVEFSYKSNAVISVTMPKCNTVQWPNKTCDEQGKVIICLENATYNAATGHCECNSGLTFSLDPLKGAFACTKKSDWKPFGWINCVGTGLKDDFLATECNMYGGAKSCIEHAHLVPPIVGIQIGVHRSCRCDDGYKGGIDTSGAHACLPCPTGSIMQNNECVCPAGKSDNGEGVCQ